MKCFSVFFVATTCVAAELIGSPPDLTQKIPPRHEQALTGSEFARSVSTATPHQREQAILKQILDGNVPRFLRKLEPVELKSSSPGGKPVLATIFVLPDYLAIGSNADFLRIPMNLETASAVADHLGFVLPTRKMVDAIYRQATYHFDPQPLPAGPEMRSTAYYETHNALIDKQAQARRIPIGALVAGDKKDVVMTNLLTRVQGRIAIYGWHRPTGVPIQPLSTVHGACYADYSHGIRLVSKTVLIDKQPRPIAEALKDPQLGNVLSDEGPIRYRLASPQSTEDLMCGLDASRVPALELPLAP
jgi:hypothetical protein